MSPKFNAAQSRHLANSLRAYGLGQMAAFGYTGIQLGHWAVVFVSAMLLMLFEVAALAALKEVEGQSP